MPSQEFWRVLYVSEALVDPCGDGPRNIIDVSTVRNASLGVTGVLCFSGDHFAQLLEGPPGALDVLMGAIRRDARHRILREWSPETAMEPRWYPGWAMGYVYDERIEALLASLGRGQEPHAAMGVSASALLSRLELYGGHML